MQKKLIPTAVVFQALSLGTFMVRESVAAALVAIACAAVFSFLCFLERRALAQVEHLEARTKAVEDRVTSLTVGMSF